MGSYSLLSISFDVLVTDTQFFFNLILKSFQSHYKFTRTLQWAFYSFYLDSLLVNILQHLLDHFLVHALSLSLFLPLSLCVCAYVLT